MTKEDYAEWKQDPRTKDVFAGMRRLIAEWRLDLGNGGTLSDTADKTAMATSQLVGKIEGMESVMDMTWQEFSGEDEETENESVG